MRVTTDRLPILDPATVHRVVLANGLTVLVRRDATAPVVAVVTYVKAGYFDETDDVVGIAHVLEHMFFKGTERRGVGEISRETKAAGGYLNAHTIYDHTSYYAVLPVAGFLSGLEVQADAYARSVIDGSELAKELEVIIQEARRKEDNPGAVATESLYELLHDRHRMRRWRIGREAGLRTLDRERLLRFYRGFYRPSNTILSIVGDVDPEETVSHVSEMYGPLADGPVSREKGPAEPAHGDFRYREWGGDIAQTQLLAGWRTPGTLHPDTPALDLAATLLGTGRASRLYRAVRERQLASSVSAYDYTPTEIGVFVVNAETAPSTTLAAGRAIWAQLRAVRQEGVGVAELERARSVYEARWIRRLETMEGQANYLAEWEALGGVELADLYLSRLLTTSPEQLTDVVRRYLDPSQAGVVVYRPASAPPLAEHAEAMRMLLDSEPAAALPVSPPRQAMPLHPPARSPMLEKVEGGVRVYRARSGLPILIRHKPGAPIAHLGAYVLGGASAEELHAAGLTTLVARTMLKGTARRAAAQIAEDAELLGGCISAGAGAEHAAWAISVPAKHAAAALALLADVIQHATIPAEALETERAVAIADVRMLRDDMYRWPMRLATRAAFEGHAYGIPAGGTESSLAAIDLAQAREWHRERILRGRVVVAAVGDLDADDFAALAARDFASLEPGGEDALSVPTWPLQPVVVAESRDKSQTALAMLYPGPARRDGSRFAAQLLSMIASGLGGRFFDELRDRRSLAYTIHAFAAERRLAGVFGAYIATSPAREDEARAGLLHEFAKLRESPVNDDELSRARTYALGTHAIAQQSGSSVLSELVDAWLFGEGLGEIDAYESRIRGVTARDILLLAREHFDDRRRVEGIVRGRS